MEYIWFGIFLVLLIIEIFTTDLVTIWFVIGSIAAFGVSCFNDNLILQIGVFLAVSIITLIVTRPLVKKFKIKNIKTNYDSVVGKEAVVTKEITSSEFGEVKVNGALWTACSKETLVTGTKVLIERIDGVKLIVKKEV